MIKAFAATYRRLQRLTRPCIDSASPGPSSGDQSLPVLVYLDGESQRTKEPNILIRTLKKCISNLPAILRPLQFLQSILNRADFFWCIRTVKTLYKLLKTDILATRSSLHRSTLCTRQPFRLLRETPLEEGCHTAQTLGLPFRKFGPNCSTRFTVIMVKKEQA